MESDHRKFKFSLSEDDFLTYNLFTASNSKEIQNKEKKGRLFTSIIFLVLAVISSWVDKISLSIYFFISSVASGLFFNKYFRWRYKKHYTNHIKQNYSERIGEMVSIWFDDEYLYSVDKTGEGKLKLSEIDLVNEINTHFFIKITTGQSVIIPKAKLDSLESFENELKKASLKISSNPEWKW